MKLRESYQTLLRQWRIHRIDVARERLQTLLETTPRYWRAAEVGGGSSLDLGCVTMKQALSALTRQGHGIIHVDVEQSFVAIEKFAIHSPGSAF